MPTNALTPTDATARLCSLLDPVGVERLSRSAAAGRVLAGPLRLDRDSPACDVSAMDGFAVRCAELASAELPIAGECRIGEAPAALPAASALRIYTGSPVPVGADAVARLERVVETDGVIRLLNGAGVPTGADIRRQGENGAAGDVVLLPGVELTAAAVGALATVGPAEVEVYRRLRVTVITTGNELEQEAGAQLPPWRLRDSNGPALQAMLDGLAWVGSVEWRHAEDSLDALCQTLEGALTTSDVVALTGGVSKGAYDYVPDAVRKVGGDVVFHRISARPGQPTLGATAAGKAIVGLPGNPLAVLTAGRSVLLPALRRLAGFSQTSPAAPQVTLEAWDGKPIPLTWWRPVTLCGDGRARLASLRGSGDVCGPAASDGFVEVPPDTQGVGPFAYYAWRP